MKAQRTQTLVLIAALVGCSSSSNDENPPGSTPVNNLPAMNQPAMNQPSTAGPAPTTMDPGTSNPTAMVPMGTAGSAAMDPGEQMKPVDEMKDPADPMMVDNGEFPDIRGVGCNPNSGFPGDEACLAPPPPGEGLQIHIGPSDYSNPDEINKFVFHPGQESSNCWTIKLPNTETIYYQTSVLSGRAGTHHIINTGFKADAGLTEGGFTPVCEAGFAASGSSIGALPGASKSYMARRPVAPENKGLGREVPAGSFLQSDMHYFNFTDKDILREYWLNLYFIKKEEVTDTPNQVRLMGGFDFNITPGTDHVYQYSAPIMADGRIIELLGHYHAHGKRFSAYIKRASGKQEKVFEMYNYLDPLIFDYNTIAENPPFSSDSGGAVSGVLEVKAGDTIQWECHIVNDSDTTLTYINEVQAGEMCNLWGASVGNTITGTPFGEVPFEVEAQ